MQLTQLPSKLDALEEAWRRAGVPVDEMYAPGLDAEETRSILAASGLAVPDEVVEWFAWHNGCVIPRVGTTPLGPTSSTAYSLREALKTRSERAEQAEYAIEDLDPETDPSDWWDPTWLPIAEDGGQGVFAVELREHSDRCPVRYVQWSDSSFRDVREDSLADLVDVWLAILELDGWTWSTELGHWTGVYAEIPLDLRLRSLM